MYEDFLTGSRIWCLKHFTEWPLVAVRLLVALRRNCTCNCRWTSCDPQKKLQLQLPLDFLWHSEETATATAVGLLVALRRNCNCRWTSCGTQKKLQLQLPLDFLWHSEETATATAVGLLVALRRNCNFSLNVVHGLIFVRGVDSVWFEATTAVYMRSSLFRGVILR